MNVDAEQMVRMTKAVGTVKFNIEEFEHVLKEAEKSPAKITTRTVVAGGRAGTEVTEPELDRLVKHGVKKTNEFKKEGVKSLDLAFLWQCILVVISVGLGIYSSLIPTDLNTQILVGFGIPITTGSAVFPTLRKEGGAWRKNRIIIHNFCNAIVDRIEDTRFKGDVPWDKQHKYIWRYLNRLYLVKGVLSDPELPLKIRIDNLDKLLKVPPFPPPVLDTSILN